MVTAHCLWKNITMLGKLRVVVISSIIFCAVFVILFGMYCPISVCPTRENIYLQLDRLYKNITGNRHAWLSGKIEEFSYHELHRKIDIDPEKEDVLVFLHIQKTGGTLIERNLVQGLVEYPCQFKRKKRYTCRTGNDYIWLFSRYSTGWACGLHADWTELNACVENKMNNKEKHFRKRSYSYLTILRHPVDRYVSEWRHVQRGATWGRARLICNGRKPTPYEWPLCYSGEDWYAVKLDAFLSCATNLANNRMTRMLANLSLVHCYNQTALPASERRERMLRSAQQNLANMPFVGIADHLVYSQYLFHRTFGLTFKEIFQSHNATHSSLTHLSAAEQERIRQVNSLDIELYDYALQLFLKRVGVTILADERLPSTIVDTLKRNPATSYLLEHEAWLSDILRTRLMEDGSRYPDPKTIAKRHKKWRQKLARELEEVQKAEEDEGQ